ncbi:hypothetical protein GIB67_036212 [Kingdonia uniflora]|uniref:Pentatricopeptide repeat-containing protein n=1 Tax=Kingdonia uniflora TaxID=39325 RepID=A0A7J7MYX2_9MAGN|nr:hypothetical protein GIB67_036212 [Kingdonia uniflora]
MRLLQTQAQYNSLRDARKVFDRIREVNLVNPVNWHMTISCLFRSEDHKSAYELFYLMKCPNDITWSAVITGFVIHYCYCLSACGQLRDLCFGEQVHGYAIKISPYVKNDGFVGSSLVDLYGYVENNCQDEAWEIFRSMHQEGSATPNSVIMAIVIPLCTVFFPP